MQSRLGRVLGGLVMSAVVIAVPDGALAVNSTGPYYAEPSWDQKLPAATRFVVLTDWNSEAVLDRETGLVWEKSPATERTVWEDAVLHCLNRNIGGRKGWRLPSITELTSLIDPTLFAPGLPKLPAGHPFTNVIAVSPPSGPPFFYWSATTEARDPNGVYAVDFLDGSIVRPSKEPVFFGQIWCARGGMNVDQY